MYLIESRLFDQLVYKRDVCEANCRKQFQLVKGLTLVDAALSRQKIYRRLPETDAVPTHASLFHRYVLVIYPQIDPIRNKKT